MLTKGDLETLAETRLREAETLLTAGHFSGAYYLGGYAVELALKACIASAFQPGAIPDRRFVEKIYTHDLRQLVGLAQLEADRIVNASVDPIFAQHWEYVTSWSEGARYTMVDEVKARSSWKQSAIPNMESSNGSRRIGRERRGRPHSHRGGISSARFADCWRLPDQIDE